jgi:microcystin-dependent protein
MATPFLAEVKIFSFGFPPKGWAFCDGQLLPINQNQALFALLGTTYGGDGRVTFGLPNLQGRVPVHVGAGINLGEIAGEQSHTITASEMAAHSHAPVGSTTSPPTAGTIAGNLWSANAAEPFAESPNTAMNPNCISFVGGSQPHENMSPCLTLNFCIALQGIFPSQS